MNVKRFAILVSLVVAAWLQVSETQGQTSTEFWFAPPQVTSGHSTGGNPTYLRIAASNQPATVTISQPANAGFTPIVLNVAANTSVTENLTAYLADLMTHPANTVLNTGLKVEATAEITCYYEISSPQNPDIWALKGRNGLGNEFYVPMQNIWRNGNYSPTPYTSFDIVATEDNTTILIYPTSDLDGGQPAFQSFTVVLNTGQTYSGSVTSTDPANNPTGTVLLSDKPIAVSIKDDSIWPQPAGCKDLVGDQLVPVNIVGTDYIVNKGGLTVPENAFVVATQNNTVISVDGTPQATLFNGETYRVPITNALTYISGNKPFYLIHISGFGCESGMALLPPLNCAGSEQVSFVRSTSEDFLINLLVPAGAEDAFVLNGDPSAIDPSSFSVVPGTGGAWMGSQIAFTNGQISAGTANLLTNTKEVFSLGLINGGPGSGCRFGYFSEFSAEIIVDAGPDVTVCANQETELNGSVSGGATQGIWSTNGTGVFVDNTDLATTYEPSLADLSGGGVTLTLTSVGNCFPVEDQIIITYSPAPIVDAGTDIAACANNTTVTLNGFVDVATGGLWSGGAGTFNPGPGTLHAQYTPTPTEIADGSVELTLTSTGNGNCLAESDVVEITFGPSPTADAGPDQTACANDANINLNGAVTVAGGGQWSGGSGIFSPSDQALAATYTPTPAEIANGSVTLKLTTTLNGGCISVEDQMTITFTPAPTVDAGSDRPICKNNADILLNGSVSGATGGVWVGGSGTYNPNDQTLNATYTPSLSEILGGGVTLTLKTTGNGDCIAETDNVTFNFTDPPVVNAGADADVCSNNSQIQLNGSLSGALFGVWSGGNGTFTPNTTTLNAKYSPTAAEISSGSVTLSLTSLDNGNCNPANDEVTYTFTPSPTVNAGADFEVCKNNSAIELQGSVTGAGGGEWSGGNGSYSPNNTTLNATYSPTPSEISSGSVTLTLSTTNYGNCNVVSDNVVVSFTPAPTAVAGPDQVVCANNSEVSLSGAVTVATGGVWSGGLGIFSPNANALNATYTPTQTEINSGSLTLTLTTIGNGNCSSESDDMVITFTPAPTVDAGAAMTACANNAQLSLSGSVGGASGGVWSGGNGTFVPNANNLNALYNPTPAEIASGSLVLTLTSTGNGNCLPVDDFVNITFTEAPTANAGNDVTVCANAPEVNLNGSVNRALGGIWMGGSGTFNPNNTALGATYTPSAAELAAGTVTLILHTTGNGNCNSVSDQMTITITPAPVVDAGIGEEVCSNNPTIDLDGSVTVATGGAWSGGNGTFSPNGTTLNATYAPSQSEINSGSITLTLTSTGNGNCVPVSDDVTYTFSPSPTADAGADQILCANNAEAALGGTVTIASGGTWSGGSGNFSPSANDLNAFYTPTPEEIASGSVTLTLTTTGNDDCNAVSDDVKLTFTPAPTANAGSDVTVCANAPDVILNGSVTIATGGTWSGGTGTFFPDADALNATYTPSASEITAGTVTLTLATTGNGDCLSVSDQMTITITPAPIVDAGVGGELCSNNAAIVLDGSVTGAAGGAWSGGNGTFSPNGTTLNATYAPSQSEINSGSITLTLTSTGNGNCVPVSDDVTYTFSPSPTADAGADQILCANNAEAALGGTVTIASGGTWSGGSGNFSPSANDLNAFYAPTPEEIASGSVTLTLTTTGNDDCNAVSDNVKLTFTPAPKANAGSDVTVCANAPDVILNGSVTIATGGTWSGGTGTFSPDADALNATYTPSASEITAGTVTLTLATTGNGDCLSESDQMTITITPAPIVDAGVGGELCSNNAAIVLDGSVTGAAGGAWSGGNGTFSPNGTTLNATYAPSQSEINSGSITLTLTSTGNGNCVPVSDDVTYTFSPSPTADAGADQILCANNAEAALGGTVTIASGGTWSGGNGNFSPGANDLNAFYAPTPEEIASGSVTLTLTTTGNDDCNAVSDDVKLTFTPAPTANAGSDVTVCANAPDVILNGSVTIATGGTWSGGTGTFSPDADALNATYTPSASEITAGTVTLTLATTGNGDCLSVSDQMTITITPAPIVDAGVGGELCSNNAAIVLDGSVTVAAGGAWSGGNGTFSPNGTTLNATYAPSQSEINFGSITLTLTSTGNGNCVPVSDDVTYTFSPSPTADAGADQILCANNAEAALGGTVTIASGGTWSGGNGNFSPGANDLNAFYAPTPEEIASGSVTLTLTTTGNDDCNAVSDDVKLTFTPAPTANAGSDVTVCANAPDVILNGSVTIATGGMWSGGTGTFSPDADALNATYTPSASEITAGTVTLILATTGNGDCLSVSDQMTITITPAPIVDAGVGGELCSNNAAIVLDGSVTVAAGGAWSGGNGTFSPNGTTLNATYAPSQSEINFGSITLTLTSTGNGNCVPVSDDVTYTFSPSPTADAGADQILCANNAVAALGGTVTIASGGTWSGGNGNFSPGANDLNAFYAPTPEEIASGSVTLTLTTTGNDDCNAVSDDVKLTFTPAPTANAGSDVTVCANAPDVILNGSVTIATGGTWSGGTGTFFPDADALNATYTPSASEITAGTVTLTLATTGNGDCLSESDQMTITITPAPIVNAGSDLTICSNNAEFELDGSVLNAGGGKWSGGLGVYSPSKNDLDATYTPTLPEIVSGSITFTLTSTDNQGCVEVTDEMTVTFTPAPTVNAGEDFDVCAGSPQSQLSGEFTIASNAQWSGGAGSFSPNALDMNAIYNPAPSELTDGSVTLTLTTIGNGNCIAESDEVTITFNPVPMVNAGPNLVSCANDPNVELQGNFSQASGVKWSGGTGFFNPINEDPNAIYTPSYAEILNGSVTLTLTSFGSGQCPEVTDNMTITINPSPVVDAGLNQEICSNNSLVNLSGSVTYAGGGQWSGGAGVFTPSNSALGANYQPTPGEVSNGFVTLTLTSTGNGNCQSVSDQVTITFTPAPLADAGADMTLCINNPEVALSGSYTVAAGAAWSGGAGSFNPDNTTPTAIYTPSQTELNNGSVILTLTTFGNGNCLPSNDQVEIIFTPSPVVDAGEDYYACVDNLTVPLNGSVSGGTTTGKWSTDGSGVFVPNTGALNASYLASSQDSLMGEVTLTLTSTNNGNCLPETDEITIFISPAGTANAGPDQAICVNNSDVHLSGTIGGAAAEGVWSSSGTGMFIPSPQAVNATYLPSEADMTGGEVTLTFSVNSCNQASDDMVVTFTPAPEVNAGQDITTCSSESDVQLNGFVFGAGTTGSWTATGTGTFSPSPNALNAFYEFSAEDIANQGVDLILTSTNVGNCMAVSDTLRLNIFHQGTVNVGADAVACDNNPELQLSAEISGGDMVLWTSTGTGSFAPNNTTLDATYVPSQGDLVNGSVNIALTITNSCNNATDFLNLSFIPGPTANAGPDQEVCGDIVPFHLTGTVNNAGGGHWMTLGSGTFQNPNNLNTFYLASQDDIDQGGTQLVLTTTDNGNCFASIDTLELFINTGIVVDAGPDRQACTEAGQIQLFGSISEESAGGVWTTDGNGSFSPNSTALNAVYNFTADDINSGSVTLTLTSTDNGICEEQSDEFILTFGDAAYVFAGPDVQVCASSDLIELNGVVSGDASTGQWSTTGTGTFFPSSTSLIAYYEPSSADLDAGSVDITLTSTNSTLCNEGSSSMEISFQPLPNVNAGNDAVVCGDISPIQLLGTVSNAEGGIWSTSGSGGFLPNDSVLTAVYMPSEADSISGNVTLTLTSYGSGLCAEGSDQISLSFADAVSVTAGADIEVCETSGSVPLNGLVQGSGGVEWSTSGTGYFDPSPNQTAANYIPSMEDIQGGQVTLYLFAASNGNCPQNIDSLKLDFDALPVVNVDTDWDACTTSPTVGLFGQVSHADEILWTSAGGGSFEPDAMTLNATYIPSATELANGEATLTLNATSLGACGSVSKEITIEFIAPAGVDAGEDVIVCASENSIALNGVVSGSTTSGQWSTNSFGSFSPDANDLDATYIFGQNDVLVGFAKLILTSVDNGPCEAVRDTMNITINPIPVANAGPDLYVCKTTGVVALSGNVDNETSFEWTTFGDGVFLPSNTEFNPEYVIGNNDANVGMVKIELTALGLEGCAPAKDTVTVHVSNPLNAGFSHSGECAGHPVYFTDETEVFDGEISQWKWDFGDGMVTNVRNPEFTYDEAGSYSVTLVVESSMGCSDTITDMVNIAESPIAAFNISANPAPTEFDIHFTDQSTGAFEWIWDFGDGTGSSNMSNPTYSYAEGGDYVVTLLVTGTSGCQDSTRVRIVIEGEVVLPPRLPNTFSPNDDGLNDVYYVRGGPFSRLDFRVYDGWGREIFKTTDQERGWDGTQNGKQMPTGVYVYTVKATNTEGNTYDYSGQINLVR